MAHASFLSGDCASLSLLVEFMANEVDEVIRWPLKFKCISVHGKYGLFSYTFRSDLLVQLVIGT